MEVIRAKSAGFCFGVKRAVEKVYEQIEAQQSSASPRPIYTYGPIIHNESVVQDLERKGVRVLETPEELERLKEGIVIIRSHGVPRSIYEKAGRPGLECVDATCPFVKRIHRIVEKESAAGSQVVIIGNAGHPEVEGIRGWSCTPAAAVETREEAERFLEELDKGKWGAENPSNSGKKLCIVSQTTFNYNKFQELVEIFQKKVMILVL